MRNSERKRRHNRSIRLPLRSKEKSFRALVGGGKKSEAAAALPGLFSALDKAVKSGVLHRATADRKKSRLTLAANRLA
jgi:small subunit ribosomal protein S20